jgi:FemAB-related protein (PEP-CTERM system-associated)
VIVERIGAEGAQDWDRYIEAAPGSTLFHRHGWGHAVARTLGHETINLAALRDGRMVGALPLVHKRSRIFGDALISVAFATGGGVLADDPAVAAVLESEALRLGAELHAGHVELRDGAPRGASTLCAPWQVVDSIHAGFRAPIPPDDGAVLRSIPRKGRRHDVKRSLSAGLDFVPDAPFESFYRVFAESYRNLGTPVFPRAYLRALCDAFPAEIRIFLVRRAGVPLAATMAIIHKGAILPYYTGGTRAARGVGANDFLFFNLMRHGREAGCQDFDFGRSKVGTGSHAYKRSWGFAPVPMAYRFAMLQGGDPPRLDPLNPKYRALIAAWQRLPVSFANRIGPFVARQIG